MLITSAHDGTGRLFVVQQNGVIKVFNGSGGPLGTAAGRQEPRVTGRRAGPPRPGVPPRLRDQPQVLRELHEHGGQHDHARVQGIGVEPQPGRRRAPAGRSSRSTSRSRTTTAATSSSGRAATCSSGWATAAAAGDPGNRAQDTGKLLGKMLRIDVNGTSGSKHYRIPASNPYVGQVAGATRSGCAASATRGDSRSTAATGRLWIGDVGQGRYEEVDRISTARKGANLGWRRVEGHTCYNPSRHCHKAGTVKPILAYSHAEGRCAVTGGYVYRGSNIPALIGLVRVRRLLQRRDLGGVVDGRHAREQGPAAQHGRTRSARSARTRPASCSSSTSAARSPGSTTADPVARLDGRA